MDVKTLCLGALTLGDATGYEIHKMFDDGPFGQFYDAGYGSIYPALGALLKADLVTVVQLAQEKRPDKKVYSLTPSGLALFKKALAEPPAKDRFRSDHIVRLFFADYMSKSDLQAVYDSYLCHFQTQAEKLRSIDIQNFRNGRTFALQMGLRFYETMSAFLVENQGQLLNDYCPNPMDDGTEQTRNQGTGDD